jgi:chromosome segregation ATPase
MEFDEIEKKIEWLESERKKTNQQIKEYKNRIAALEASVETQQQKLAVVENDQKTTVNVSSKLARFDAAIAKNHADMLAEMTALEKKQSAHFKSSEKQLKAEITQITNKFAEVQTFVPLFSDVRKNLQNRIDEENRLAQRLDSVEKQAETMNNTFNNFLQANKRTMDELQVEYKRVSDLQVEVTALRKRLDEERTRSDIQGEAIKKAETRIVEIENGEVERKQNQATFYEKLSLAQVERDNMWKEWQTRFGEINIMGENYKSKMDALEATHLAIKKSQASLDDVNMRFDRRINELTEMHRLSEERFRQEWISFKNEDQKRWTNYSLTQDEKAQDDTRQMSKLVDRVISLEDAAQEARDTIELINEETDKRMKAFATVLHDLMESFNQTFNIR